MTENKLTINELLALIKSVRARVSELNSLRSQVSSEEHYFGAKEKVVEPKYDVKLVDKKITELEKFLFKADALIKQSNALTTVEIEADIDVLLSPLE